jgi:hypothetical protein
MIRSTIAVSLLAAVMMLQASAASAQATDASRLELGIGLRWIGGQPLGSRTATETTSTGSTSALFSTASELAGAAGIDGRLGVRLSRWLAAEAEASYGKPQLHIATSADAESAAAVTATETIQQFTVGGNVLWRLPGKAWSPRFAPFASAGAGYLRQLHDPGTLVETGRFYQVGGGVNALVVSTRRFHTTGIGVRADVRALVRSRGVAFDKGSQVSPAAGVALFVRF